MRHLSIESRTPNPQQTRLGQVRNNSNPAWEDFTLHTLPPTPTLSAPHTHIWRSEGGAYCGRGGKNPTETQARTFGRVLGVGTGLEPSLGYGIWPLRIPAMASS